MSDKSLQLRNVGPIGDADIQFGDLTVLVGPQATGKSILLQLLKLMLDTGPVFRTLKEKGLNWNGNIGELMQVYVGEGMKGLWDERKSELRWNGEVIDMSRFARPRAKSKEEHAFFIPAHRVLTLTREGWFRTFSEYRPWDPFVVRDFSEKLLSLMETPMGRDPELFPRTRRLKSGIRHLLSRNVFAGFHLRLETSGPQKRLLLTGEAEARLPFLVWSAGQREFVPLLLGLYWLMPPTKTKRRADIQWAIIEEPEMGLHPRAIETVLLIVLDLLWRGYRVCISTHSPHVLDVVWALRHLRESHAGSRSVLKLFGAGQGVAMQKVAEASLRKDVRVYYFDPDSRSTHDISALDPSSPNAAESGWGGLTELSGRAADIVAQQVAAKDSSR